MEVSSSLIFLLVFSIPALVQNYFFQYFSRLRRPIESNLLASLSSLIVGAASVHSIYYTLTLFSPEEWWFNVPVWTLVTLLEPDQLSRSEWRRLIELLGAYLIAVTILGAMIGCVAARFVLWKVPGTEVIGRLYYGGLYNLMADPLGREISASVLIKDPLDSRSMLYKGTLEELKLGDMGAVDYLTLALPSKAIATYDANAKNVVAGDPRLLGGIPDENSGSRRLFIEGSEIANVFFEATAPKSTIERRIFDAIVYLSQSVTGSKALYGIVLTTVFLALLMSALGGA